MTGQQPNPGTGKNAQGKESKKIDLMMLVKATGIGFAREVNPYNVKRSTEYIKDASLFDGPAVIIFKAPCVLKEKKVTDLKFEITGNIGTGKQACAAIKPKGEGKTIDKEMCVGCSICAQIATPGSIRVQK
ncbi:MAG: thiamine pyrophosphate-dependent enzyme, partial [archaeon]|nr:thiamine pyrophosphate-dependent enzyme [archaeon]